MGAAIFDFLSPGAKVEIIQTVEYLSNKLILQGKLWLGKENKMKMCSVKFTYGVESVQYLYLRGNDSFDMEKHM